MPVFLEFIALVKTCGPGHDICDFVSYLVVDSGERWMISRLNIFQQIKKVTQQSITIGGVANQGNQFQIDVSK